MELVEILSAKNIFNSKFRKTRSPPPSLTAAGAAVPGAARGAAGHQGGEPQAEAEQRRAGAGAGAEQPGAAAGPGAAERAAGAVVAAARGEGDVSVGSGPISISSTVPEFSGPGD